MKKLIFLILLIMGWTMNNSPPAEAKQYVDHEFIMSIQDNIQTTVLPANVPMLIQDYARQMEVLQFKWPSTTWSTTITYLPNFDMIVQANNIYALDQIRSLDNNHGQSLPDQSFWKHSAENEGLSRLDIGEIHGIRPFR